MENVIPTWLLPVEEKFFEVACNPNRNEAIEWLQRLDIRDELFPQVAIENLNKVNGLSEALQLYRQGGMNDIIIKTSIGKMWAKKLHGQYGYDYDASLYSNYIFWKTMFSDIAVCPIEHAGGYQYTIRSNGVSFRGDTMNSWATTLHEFFRLYGGGEAGYLNGLVKNDSPGINNGKWRIPRNGPDWDKFLSMPENYKRALPSYITEFMKVIYTPGNFIPIPHGCNVYTLKDYFDLKLYCIYNWYQDHLDSHIMSVINDSTCQHSIQCRLQTYKGWLESFTDWDTFVRRYALQPFVSIEGSRFGRPRELWDGHFESWRELPRTEGEFEQFFVNAKVRILARGTLVAKKLMEELTLV